MGTSHRPNLSARSSMTPDMTPRADGHFQRIALPEKPRYQCADATRTRYHADVGLTPLQHSPVPLTVSTGTPLGPLLLTLTPSDNSSSTSCTRQLYQSPTAVA